MTPIPFLKIILILFSQFKIIFLVLMTLMHYWQLFYPHY